jgi:hypothetical protein
VRANLLSYLELSLWLYAYYVLRLAELSAIDYKKALCCYITWGRKIWQGAHRSPILCGVGFVALCIERR